MKKIFIFLDGQFVLATSALQKMLTPGVMDYPGVFETMLVYKGKILFLEKHMARLRRGLELYRLKMPYSLNKIVIFLNEVIERNQFVHARIRLSVWQEHKVRVAVVGQDIAQEASKNFSSGYRVMLSSYRHPKMPCAHVKSLAYHVFRLAYLEAQDKGFDEAFLLNARGHLVEGATTNIFLVRKRSLITPSLRCGCLNGITRQIVLNLARDKGISCRIENINEQDLLQAQEVFVTNALIGIMPVKSLGGNNIASGGGKSLARELHRQYSVLREKQWAGNL